MRIAHPRRRTARRMAQISEAERIIKLMLYVREAQPVSFSSIQNALLEEYGPAAGSEDSNRRRFERDKRTLQENGVFLSVGADQKYSIDMSRTAAAPLDLTQAQVSLLRLLCGALLEDRAYPFKDELRMVLVKLGDELEIPDMLPQFDQKSVAKSSEPQGLGKVKKAIAARKRVSFAYTNAKGQKSKRTVEPMGAFFINRHCYVVAYDVDAKDERVFRLDRMSGLRINSTNPKSPDFAERPFDVTKYFGLPFQFGDDDLVATIQLEEPALSRAAQLTMGLGEIVREDDHCIWTIPCKNPAMLAQWCIESGPGIIILEPEAAREAYANGLHAYAARMNEEAHDEG